VAPFRSALFLGHVMHQRTRPRPHRLRYRIFYFVLDLDELTTIASSLSLFSVNRFNAFSFFERDHGDGSDRPLRDQIGGLLAAAGVEADGAVELLTMPRVLGYVFNPLSLYFCRRRDGTLATILYEVNNTFGERHTYLIPAAPDLDGRVRQESCKSLHVSPFLANDMRYAFVVTPPGERLAVSVTGRDMDGPILFAKLAAVRQPLSDAALVRTLLAYPLVTMKVIAGIHWHALRLWLKGVPMVERLRRSGNPLTFGRAMPASPRHEESGPHVRQ
jgi:uncharacterized protein